MHGGRLEIYVNDTKVYDRKEAEGAADFYPSLKEMRKAKDVLAEAIAAATSDSDALFAFTVME